MTSKLCRKQLNEEALQMNEATPTGNTLKSRNLAWLVATLILDCLILLVLAFHTIIEDLTPDRILAIRASLATLLPISALLLSSLVSADHKATLVFWRLSNPLPGSRAFSMHAPADHRVDLETLKRKGRRVSRRRAYSKWYTLYKQVDSDPSVVESHRITYFFETLLQCLYCSSR
jgi:hypothetical protein